MVTVHRSERNGFATFNFTSRLFDFYERDSVALLFQISVNSVPANHVPSTILWKSEAAAIHAIWTDTFPECNDRVFAAGHIEIADYFTGYKHPWLARFP